MNSSWYKKSMPHIKDINTDIISERLNNINGVKKVYVWREFLDNIKNKNHVIKKIDVIAMTSFSPEDIASIIDNEFSPFATPVDELEEEGFDPEVVKFTKSFINIPNVSCWCIAGDKIFHWGPIVEDKETLKQMHEEAESYASVVTGFSRKKLQKSSQLVKDKWSLMYDHHVNKVLKDIPCGWQEIAYDRAEIFKNAKEI